MGYSNWVNMNTRILKALQTGQDFTANQLRAKFGIRRVSDRISELRKAGYTIYLNTKTTSWGNKIRVYRLGNPRRSDVATANFVKTHGYMPYDHEVNDLLNNYVRA
jgi:hypothetical protein